MSYLYICEECGNKKRLEGKWRGVDCPNCESIMNLNGIDKSKIKRYLKNENLLKGGK